MSFAIDIDKSIEACHYILGKVGNTDFHKLFKILYFAEQKHLADYGRPITCDSYIAMNNGPVPSFIYSMLKHVRGDNPYFNIGRDVNSDFDVTGKYYVASKRQALTDYLSETDIEYIDNSIADNRNLSFTQLTDKSHGDAWQKASQDNEMSILDIALEGGAEQEMLKYIKSNLKH